MWTKFYIQTRHLSPSKEVLNFFTNDAWNIVFQYQRRAVFLGGVQTIGQTGKQSTRGNVILMIGQWNKRGLYPYIHIFKYAHLIDRDDAEIKAHNHYDTWQYFISLFREAGCAMFGFMLYSRRRSCFFFWNFRDINPNARIRKRSRNT